MSKSSFYGITAVALVAAAGLVSVTAAKWDEQEYLSRALLVEARVNDAGRGHNGATSTATTTSGKPDMNTDKPGIHNTERDRRNYKLITGSVKSISAGSFVLTARRTNFSITIGTSTARIYNRVWVAMPLSGIMVGDKVAVYGMVDGTSIAARIIRDISKPAHSNDGGRDADHATSTNRGRGNGRGTSTDED